MGPVVLTEGSPKQNEGINFQFDSHEVLWLFASWNTDQPSQLKRFSGCESIYI